MTRTPGCVRAHAMTVSSIARFWYSDEPVEKSDMKPVQTVIVKGLGIGDWGLAWIARFARASKRGLPVTTKVAVCLARVRYHASACGPHVASVSTCTIEWPF